MNTRYVSIIASLLFALMASDAVRASEDASLPSVSTEMTQEEYAAYRARIREQLEAAQQAESKEEADKEQAETTTRRKPDNGYGQGYRARQERSRGEGMMGRGAGRNR